MALKRGVTVCLGIDDDGIDLAQRLPGLDRGGAGLEMAPKGIFSAPKKNDPAMNRIVLWLGMKGLMRTPQQRVNPVIGAEGRGSVGATS